MRKTIAALTCAAAAVLATAGCGSAKDGTDVAGNSANRDTTTQPSAPEASDSNASDPYGDPGSLATETTAESGPKSFAMGEKGTISNDTDGDVLELTISSPRTVRGDEFTKPEKGRFLAITVTFKALSAGQDVNPFDFVAVSSDGQRYQPTFGPDAGVTQLDSGTLNTGEVSKGSVVFDVPRTGITGIAYAPLDQILGTWKLA